MQTQCFMFPTGHPDQNHKSTITWRGENMQQKQQELELIEAFRRMSDKEKLITLSFALRFAPVKVLTPQFKLIAGGCGR